MKRLLLAIMAMFTIALSANAMSYEQARREALFLTDKMAYELNLTQEQYDAAYEINLDYLMGVTSVDDVYSDYWTRRNLDLSYILLDWQWNAFRAATYFYRPLYWDAGYWHFGVYARYPRRTFFYFDHPSVYVSYRGGHSWRANGGHSFYHGRRDDFQRGGDRHIGMRDNWDNGNFRGQRDNSRGSSTRVTVNNNNRMSNNNNGNNNRTSSFGNSRSSGTFSGQRSVGGNSTGNSSTNRFAPGSNNNSGTSTTGGSRSSGTFGTRRTGGNIGQRVTATTRPSATTSGVRGNVSNSSRASGSFSGQRIASPSGSSVRKSGSFGTSRSNSAPSVKSSGSFGGSSHNVTRGGGGSGSHSSGGFGGRR